MLSSTYHRSLCCAQGPDEVVYSGAMLATRLALYQQVRRWLII